MIKSGFVTSKVNLSNAMDQVAEFINDNKAILISHSVTTFEFTSGFSDDEVGYKVSFFYKVKSVGGLL